MRTRTALALALLFTLVVLAHVGLWQSERVPDALKWRLTVINAVGWSVVLIPAWLVGRWLKAHEGRD
jgi:hypothetical protein